jgi:hypothetical protein
MPPASASACSSSASIPYSSVYSALTVSLGSLARLARRHEARAQLARQRGAEDEPARLGRDHQVHRQRSRHRRQLRHGLVERRGVQQQRRDVLEDDPRPRKVRDVADELSEVDGAHRRIKCFSP